MPCDDVRDGLHAPRTNRHLGLADRARHDELRRPHLGGGRVRDHGPRAGARRQLLRHRERLRRRRRPRAPPRRSSAGGSPPVRACATTSCWRRRCTRRWSIPHPTATSSTRAARRPGRCAARRSARCAGCRPTASTSTSSTTSTGTSRGPSSGRPWRCWWRAARSSTPAARNFAAWNIAQANEIAQQRQLPGAGERAVALQPRRSAPSSSKSSPPRRTTVSASCRGRRWRGGLLSGGSSDAERALGRRRQSRRSASERRDQLDAYERFAQERGWTPVVPRSRVAAAPAGRDRTDHRPAHGRAARIGASAPSTSGSATDDLRPLDELFPGPGGQAPEAYAW